MRLSLIETWPEFFTAKRVAHCLGCCALGAVSYFWGDSLRPSTQSTSPVTETVYQPDPASVVLAQWFEPGSLRMDIAVQGIILHHGRAVAVLAVNGETPGAYRVGETLSDGVTLTAIEPERVVLEGAGGPMSFATPALPDNVPSGIVRLSSSQ